MDGLCDVNGCRNLPLLGWRPLTERRGRQICEYHWRRHLDKQDSFDLFDEFKFRRPAGIPKPEAKKDVRRCACGRKLPSGRRMAGSFYPAIRIMDKSRNGYLGNTASSSASFSGVTVSACKSPYMTRYSLSETFHRIRTLSASLGATVFP